MAEARAIDLIYGHWGQPTYDTDTRQWHFPRLPALARHIKPLGQPVCALAATRALDRVRTTASERTRRAKDFAKAYPEFSLAGASISEADPDRVNLVSTHEILVELAKTSEAVIEGISGQDPTHTEQLAFGTATNLVNWKESEKLRYEQIVAVASGAAGELVKLVVLDKAQLGWESNKDLRLDTLTARNGETGWWTALGAPIQQLVFAPTEKEKNTWLAVRYHGAISVLKPVLQSELVCPSNANGPVAWLPASRLNANHIATIPMHKSRGVPFADVSFNPWNRQQLVVINQAGRWSVWKIECQVQGKGLWSITRNSTGSLVEDEDLDLDESEPILDGWTKALWIHNSVSIVVASRRAISLFDIKSQVSILEMPDFALAKSSDWILDIQRNPLNMSQIFILTSTHLFWVKIDSFSESITLDSTKYSVTVLISWVHFRDSQDVSLSMNVLDGCSQAWHPEEEETSMVVLYSRLNSLASIFTFHYSRTMDKGSSKCDPYILPMKSNGSLLQGPRVFGVTDQLNAGISCLRLVPLASGRNVWSSELNDVHDKDVQIYQASILYRDLSMSEQLYLRWAGDDKFNLAPPDTHIRNRVSNFPKKVEEDFIVPDGVTDNQLGDVDLGFLKTTHQLGKLPPPAVPHSKDPWTIDMTWLVKATSSPASEAFLRRNKGLSRAVSFDKYLKSIRDTFEADQITAQPGIKTIFELDISEPIVTDVDDVTRVLFLCLESLKQDFTKLTSYNERAVQFSVDIRTSLPPMIVDIMGLDSDLGFLRVYENLVRAYLGQLPPRTPGRVRIAIEKQIRNVTAQVCLAAYTIRTQEKHLEVAEDAGEEAEMMMNQDLAFTLPIRRRRSIGPLQEQHTTTESSSPPEPSSPLSGAPSIHTLPTPEPPAPSQRSARSTRFISSFQNTTTDEFREDPSSHRLRTLATLTPQPVLPPKLANILTHWNVGVDPNTYDWEAAERANALPDLVALAAEEARTERSVKRARRRSRIGALTENEELALGNSIDAMERNGQSQPDLRRSLRVVQRSQGISLSSQVPESSQNAFGASSQPTAGKHGTGKKRKQPGFR